MIIESEAVHHARLALLDGGRGEADLEEATCDEERGLWVIRFRHRIPGISAGATIDGGPVVLVSMRTGKCIIVDMMSTVCVPPEDF